MLCSTLKSGGAAHSPALSAAYASHPYGSDCGFTALSIMAGNSSDSLL